MLVFTICAYIFTKIMSLVSILLRFKRLFEGKSKKCPRIVDELLLLPASDLAEKIRQRQISSEFLIKTYISRVKKVNPVINAVYENRFENAIKEARDIDSLLHSNTLTKEQLKEKYPLLGVPITIKASIAVTGMDFNTGVVKRNVKATCDGTCVKQARDAGAIPILTSNVPELCLNWETKNKVVGTTRNPYDTNKTVGGSSGGETSLLASAASIIGIGSDIAGSLRLPAHFCGVWGHKPSPGSVSLVGHYPGCKNQEVWTEVFTLGPLARYASDLRLLLQVIIQPEMKTVLKLNQEVNLENVKVYYVENFNSPLISPCDKNVINAIQNSIEHLNSVCKIKCKKIELPILKNASEIAYLRLLNVDDVENLFEGKGEGCYLELLRFLTGRSKSELTSISYGLLRRNAHLVPNRLMKSVYNKLHKIKTEFIEMLGEDGVFICPTFPTEAHSHGDILSKIFDAGYLAIFNVLGFPATNCPISFSPNGLPIGIQVVAAPNCDRLTLRVAEEFEKYFGGWKPAE